MMLSLVFSRHHHHSMHWMPFLSQTHCHHKVKAHSQWGRIVKRKRRIEMRLLFFGQTDLHAESIKWSNFTWMLTDQHILYWKQPNQPVLLHLSSLGITLTWHASLDLTIIITAAGSLFPSHHVSLKWNMRWWVSHMSLIQRQEMDEENMNSSVDYQQQKRRRDTKQPVVFMYKSIDLKEWNAINICIPVNDCSLSWENVLTVFALHYINHVSLAI